MSRSLMRRATVVTALGVFLVVAATAVTQGSEEALVRYVGQTAASGAAVWPEEDLARRFADYWKAYRNGDKDMCFSMEAPHFRYLFSESRYAAYWNVTRKLPMERVEVHAVQLRAPFFVEVPMWLVKKDDKGQDVRVGMKDRWIKVSGQWYHLMRDPIAFPGS